MDWVRTLLKQYRYVLLVLLVGIGLMLLPERQETSDAEVLPNVVQEPSMEDQLEHILSHIQHVGRVEVMLTIAAGEQTLYETDTDESYGESAGSASREVVLVTDSARTEQGLVIQRNPPTYQGAIVVCQGGEDPSVRLSIVEAVSAVTGLTTDRITVLKMK